MQNMYGMFGGQRGGRYEDPLQGRANLADKRREEEAAASNESALYRVARLAMVPFLTFLVMAFLASFLLEFAAPLVWLLCVFGVLTALAASFSVRRRFQSMLRLVALSIALGMLVGLDVYYGYLIFYWKYKNLRTYTNVSPAQSAAEFGDGSELSFSSEATIDTTRAIGYKSAQLGRTVCVAPVVDSSMQANDPVSFFAVGLDCCDYRGSFNCDDAGASSSQNALLVFRPSDLVAPALEWRVEATLHPEVYREAIEMDKVVYNTVVNINHRMVRWTTDPVSTETEFLNGGVQALCVVCVLALVLSVILVMLSTPRSLRSSESTSLLTK